MESFNTDQSVNNEQVQDQGATFKVGDREFNPESAAKKISAADEHIAKIEQENKAFQEKMAALEAQLEQSTKLEEALQKLNAGKQEVDTSQATPTMDIESLKSELLNEVKGSLTAEQEAAKKAQAEELAKATFAETQAKLVEVYGNDGVDTAIQEKAGISMQTALKMASDPEQSKVLLKIMQADKAPADIAPSGTVKTAAFKGQAPTTHKEALGGRSITDVPARELATYLSNLSKKG